MTYPSTTSGQENKAKSNSDTKSTESSPDRQKYISETCEKLDQVERQLTTMKSESGRLSGDLKRKSEDNYEKVHQKFTQMKAKIEELKTSSEENWDNDKTAFDRNLTELSSSFKS